jgi:hypothetical protein
LTLTSHGLRYDGLDWVLLMVYLTG